MNVKLHACTAQRVSSNDPQFKYIINKAETGFTEMHKARRLSWAKENLNIATEEWKHFIITDH